MAKERGAFEVFDYNKEKDNPFIKRLGKEDPGLIEDMKLAWPQEYFTADHCPHRYHKSDDPDHFGNRTGISSRI